MTYDQQSDCLGVLLVALAAKIGPAAPDLSTLLSVWAGLPDVIKAGIVAMVKVAKAEETR
jgi:hypothetical protein